MKRTIAYITDPHMDDAFTTGNQVDAKIDFEHILQEVQAAGITSVVIGGDIGEPVAHDFFFDRLKQYAADVKITLGNHDLFKEIQPFYNPLPAGRNEFYYTEEDAFYKYIYLDSSAEEISPEQFAWLEKELQTPKKAVLFIHHPVLGVDAEVDRLFPLKGREQIAALLQQHTKEVYIFCGHYHLEDEQQQGNIRQYITPAVSIQFEKTAAELVMDKEVFGYRIIHIGEEGIDTVLVIKRR